MSNYPEWWDTTLTLYNKYTDSKGEIFWYMTVLKDCFWKYTGEEVRVNDSVLSTKDTICRIPKNSDFLERYEWEQLEDKTSRFTLGRGDILVRGEVEDTIDEYTRGQRSTDLLDKYREQGCVEITEYRINTGRGRALEHYFVRGV